MAKFSKHLAIFTLVVGILSAVFSAVSAGLIDIPEDPEHPRWCAHRGQPCWKRTVWERTVDAVWGALTKIGHQNTAGVKKSLVESPLEQVQDLAEQVQDSIESVHGSGHLIGERDGVTTEHDFMDLSRLGADVSTEYSGAYSHIQPLFFKKKTMDDQEFTSEKSIVDEVEEPVKRITRQVVDPKTLEWDLTA